MIALRRLGFGQSVGAEFQLTENQTTLLGVINRIAHAGAVGIGQHELRAGQGNAGLGLLVNLQIGVDRLVVADDLFDCKYFGLLVYRLDGFASRLQRLYDLQGFGGGFDFAAKEVVPHIGLIQLVAGGRLRFLNAVHNAETIGLIHRNAESGKTGVIAGGGQGLGGIHFQFQRAIRLHRLHRLHRGSRKHSPGQMGFEAGLFQFFNADNDFVILGGDHNALGGSADLIAAIHVFLPQPIETGLVGQFVRHLAGCQLGNHLIGQQQGHAVGHLDFKALGIAFQHAEGIGGFGYGAAGGQYLTGAHVLEHDGLLIEEVFPAIGQLIPQHQRLAIVEGQGLLVDGNGVADLVGGLVDAGNLIQHGGGQNVGALDFYRLRIVIVPIHQGGVAVFEGHFFLALGNGGLTLGIQRLLIDHRMIGDENIGAVPIAVIDIRVATPANTVLGGRKHKGHRKGLAILRQGCGLHLQRLGGVVLGNDGEEILEFLPIVYRENMIAGKGIGDGDHMFLVGDLELAGADMELPQDILDAVPVGAACVIGAGFHVVEIAIAQTGLIALGKAALLGRLRGVVAGEIHAQIGVVGCAVVADIGVVLFQTQQFSSGVFQIGGNGDVVKGIIGDLLLEGLNVENDGHRIAVFSAFFQAVLHLIVLVLTGLQRHVIHADDGCHTLMDGHFAGHEVSFVAFNLIVINIIGMLAIGNDVQNLQLAHVGKQRLIRIFQGDGPLGGGIVQFLVEGLEDLQFLFRAKGWNTNRRCEGIRDTRIGDVYAGINGIPGAVEDIGIANGGGGGEIDQLVGDHRLTVFIGQRIVTHVGQVQFENAALVRIPVNDVVIHTIFERIQIQQKFVGFSVFHDMQLERMVAVDEKLHVFHGINQRKRMGHIPVEGHIPADDGLAVVHDQRVMVLLGHGLEGTHLVGQLKHRNASLVSGGDVGGGQIVDLRQVNRVSIILAVTIVVQGYFDGPGQIRWNLEQVRTGGKEASVVGGNGDFVEVVGLVSAFGTNLVGNSHSARVNLREIGNGGVPIGFHEPFPIPDAHKGDRLIGEEIHAVIDPILKGEGFHLFVDHHDDVEIAAVGQGTVSVFNAVNRAEVGIRLAVFIFEDLELMVLDICQIHLHLRGQDGLFVFQQLHIVGLLGGAVLGRRFQHGLVRQLHGEADDMVAGLHHAIAAEGHQVGGFVRLPGLGDDDLSAVLGAGDGGRANHFAGQDAARCQGILQRQGSSKQTIRIGYIRAEQHIPLGGQFHLEIRQIAVFLCAVVGLGNHTLGEGIFLLGGQGDGFAHHTELQGVAACAFFQIQLAAEGNTHAGHICGFMENGPQELETDPVVSLIHPPLEGRHTQIFGHFGVTRLGIVAALQPGGRRNGHIEHRIILHQTQRVGMTNPVVRFFLGGTFPDRAAAELKIHMHFQLHAIGNHLSRLQFRIRGHHQRGRIVAQRRFSQRTAGRHGSNLLLCQRQHQPGGLGQLRQARSHIAQQHAGAQQQRNQSAHPIVQLCHVQDSFLVRIRNNVSKFYYQTIGGEKHVSMALFAAAWVARLAAPV